MVAGTASVEVAAGEDQEMAQSSEKGPSRSGCWRPHQWKLLLMHILPKSQDPEADGGLNNRSGTCRPRGTAEYSRMRPQSNVPTEAERLAQGWCESCVRGRGGCVRGRGRAACVDVAGISLTEGGRTG